MARVAGQKSAPASSGGTTPLLDLPDQEIADLIQQAGSVAVEMLLDYFDFMAAGDEEIARSATPRFALETVLIRLATLPQTLPVAELIERLEQLEGKAPALLRSQAIAQRISEPVVAPKTAPAPTTPATSPSVATVPYVAEAAGRAPSGDVWRDFIAFVGKEKKFLASHLDAATAQSLPPGQLKIGVAERHHLVFLQDSDNFATLKDLAKRFFAADIAVQISAMLADTSAVPADRGAGASAGPPADRSEMVKEALRIFGGSVRTVRRESN